MRHGDPLDPLLFCILKDVFSITISNIVHHNMIKLIFGSRGFEVTSHCIFVDDVMIFCRGNKASNFYLINLFSIHANESEQIMNPSKSIIFIVLYQTPLNI